MKEHIRHGRGSVRPYLYGELGLPQFLCDVLGGIEVERHDTGEESAHVELAIGDSVVVVEAGRLPPSMKPTIASVYVYVANVDQVYERAMQRGATSVSAPEDKHYGERGAAIRDASGNIWYLSTYTG